jgi:hypothetical protein
MATNTSDFFTFSKTAGTAKNLQKPTDGGDNNLWGGYINVDLDTIVGAVNATSDLIADANQNELIDFTATGSAVNHVGITNAATGNGPTIEAKGDDTNIDLNVSGKGTGKLATTSPKITTGINDSNNNELIKVTATGSAVNEITVANAATGNGPTISATGDDTNIDLNIAGKGSGNAKFTSNIIIPDAANIGSVSDPDAIAIASDGGLTFSGGIDNAGAISAGAIGDSVTGNWGFKLLETETISSSTASFEMGSASIFSSTYDTFIIFFSNVSISSDADIFVQFTLTDTGLVSSGSHYDYTSMGARSNNDVQQASSVSSDAVQINATGMKSSTERGQANGQIFISAPYVTGTCKTINGTMGYMDANDYSVTTNFVGGLASGNNSAHRKPLIGLKFLLSGTTNFTSGTFRLYGVKNA